MISAVELRSTRKNPTENSAVKATVFLTYKEQNNNSLPLSEQDSLRPDSIYENTGRLEAELFA